MENSGELRLLLASRYPLLLVETQDEARFLRFLREAAGSLSIPVWTWSVTRGLALDDNAPQYGTTEATKALDHIAQLSSPGVFVLADSHHALADSIVVRKCKELAQAARPGQTLVLTAPAPVMPDELRGLGLPWSLKPPSRTELAAVVRHTMEDLAARKVAVALDDAEVAALVEALRGLTLAQAERLVQRAALDDGRLDGADIEFIREEKSDELGLGGAIELIETHQETLTAVGGLERLKEWLRLRGRAFEPAAAAFGLEAPRGVLITGVPGCGKSLAAKTLARTWKLPLLLLDASRLYGPYVGESEQRLRDSLRTVEAMSPAVVWIDEVEKGFASGGAGDGGVSKRLLGTFLSWMQERPEGVFVVATSNDVTTLPPELLRKGRFDEIFFVDLPNPAERAEIVRLHLASRKRDPAGFDLPSLVAVSEGFSGAEIEAAIVGALYRSYAAGAELTDASIIEEMTATVPLSRTRSEDVDRIRAWAAGRAVPASAASEVVRTSA
jgi:AAA+ superfamily predicted ATPase